LDSVWRQRWKSMQVPRRANSDALDRAEFHAMISHVATLCGLRMARFEAPPPFFIHFHPDNREKKGRSKRFTPTNAIKDL